MKPRWSVETLVVRPDGTGTVYRRIQNGIFWSHRKAIKRMWDLHYRFATLHELYPIASVRRLR
jgi:hypothetical protein